MSIFRIFLSSYVKNNIKDIHARLINLEKSVDCLIENPKYVSSSNIGFNGQNFRKKIFLDLLGAIDFQAIVETGTYFGDTTGYMAEMSKLHIYSCELNQRFHSIAKTRLVDFQTIHLELEDSRKFLKKLGRSELKQGNVFFYLDAHWYEDMPLVDEIRIIARNWERFVVMIDDFMVPNDDGYGYDIYGKEKTFSLGLIENIVNEYDLIPFFPSLPSEKETGHKRGCVVLASKALSEKVSRINSLTRDH